MLVLRYLAASGFALRKVKREEFGDSQSALDNYHRTRKWLERTRCHGLRMRSSHLRVRSPWQRVRNAVRAVAIGRYWWKICQ